MPAAEETGEAASPPRRPRESVPDADGATRILVLDDDPRSLRQVRDALGAEGYAPVVTGDPEELGDLLRDERPALALLDVALPGADGIELMREIPELSELPVIFISAYGRDETVAKALDAGAADYIVKPFSATEYALLRVLSLNAGRVAPFEALVRQVWGEREQEQGGPRLVHVYVTHLRLKRGENAERPAWIFNVRGVGYRMPDPGQR